MKRREFIGVVGGLATLCIVDPVLAIFSQNRSLDANVIMDVADEIFQQNPIDDSFYQITGQQRRIEDFQLLWSDIQHRMPELKTERDLRDMLLSAYEETMKRDIAGPRIWKPKLGERYYLQVGLVRVSMDCHEDKRCHEVFAELLKLN